MSNLDTSQPTQLARCSVTGNLVPEDELINFQGQLVCAEGKAILLDRLKAGEALVGGMERPRILLRFGCIVLDNIILAVAGGLVGGLLGAGMGIMKFPMATIFAAAQIAAAIIAVTYFTMMHAARGQTLGKMAGKIMVVNLDGTPISFRTAFIRALIYYGPSFLNIVLMFIFVSNAPPPGQPTTPFNSMTIGSALVGCWYIADLLVGLLDTNQQRTIHDRIAGTRVIVREPS